MNNDPARISAVVLSNLAAFQHHLDDIYDLKYKNAIEFIAIAKEQKILIALPFVRR
jgi:hypothetical protein